MKSSNISNYFQPNFYHFSSDSTLLSSYASEVVFKEENLKVLDLFAGVGIIGLEYLQKTDRKMQLSFCELQSEFYPYFEKNKNQLLEEKKQQIKDYFVCDFRELFKKENLKNSFDLILLNPPYFFKGQGKNPSDIRRERCRFFSPQDFEDIFKVLDCLLKKEGRAFITMREIYPLFKEKTETVFENSSIKILSYFPSS